MRSAISKTLFALVALSATAGSALADESLDSAARDSSVSTIHGQLVPVGDKNQYQLDFKPWNVSLNPIGVLTGIYSASASYGITQNLALRVDGSYYDPVGTDTTGYELGVGAPIYLRRTYQGAFVEPGFIVRELDSHDASEANAKTKEMGPQVLLGWHWTWDSGLNASIAFGLGRNLSADDSSDDSKTFANGYLRIGYEF